MMENKIYTVTPILRDTRPTHGSLKNVDSNSCF